MRVSRRTALLVLAMLAMLDAAGIGYLVHRRTSQPPVLALPLRTVAEVGLPGSTSRFDYASIDARARRLFIAHLGDSEMLTVDTTTNRDVRRTAGLADVHGVLVVPQLHRVFATATGSNQLVALDEDSGVELWRAPTGDYPDGMAYVASTGQVWVSNETGGTETAVDGNSGQLAGTVELGGEAGNVAFDAGAAGAPATLLVDVQSSNELVAIDPVTRAIRHRTRLGGCNQTTASPCCPRAAWPSSPAGQQGQAYLR